MTEIKEESTTVEEIKEAKTDVIPQVPNEFNTVHVFIRRNVAPPNYPPDFELKAIRVLKFAPRFGRNKPMQRPRPTDADIPNPKKPRTEP